MAKLERKTEITLPLPEQEFRRFADLWSGLKCGHTMARRSAQANALGSAGSELINLPWDAAMIRYASVPSAVSVHGLRRQHDHRLVNKGLAILTHEKVRADGKMIDVSKVLITEAGRGALAWGRSLLDWGRSSLVLGRCCSAARLY
jgi:hypothetical protein